MKFVPSDLHLKVSFLRMGMSPRAGCVVWDFEVWP